MKIRRIHTSAEFGGFLAEEHFHPPTYSSWLNQVESWFSRIERVVIPRGVFSSVFGLARKLIRFTRAYSAHAKSFKWKYSDRSRHIDNLLFARGH